MSEEEAEGMRPADEADTAFDDALARQEAKPLNGRATPQQVGYFEAGFNAGAEWERARHVPVEGDDEIPCAFQMEQCRCALPRWHSGLHECRRHRFSDRSLAALGGGE